MNREQQKQITREKILLTSARLFQEVGYNKVSTRLIAKEAGVAIGTVFAHFEDKKTLTMALFHHKLDAIIEGLFQEASTQPTGLEFFLSYANGLYDFYNEDRAFSIALLQSSFFDVAYFEQQVSMFIALIADKLKTDYPKLNGDQHLALAKSFFGFYFFQLMLGLKNPNTRPQEWLQGLRVDCEMLLSTVK
ncbi:TetR/AcrR family transcriptional regulator [Reinekea sp.]|jgi:AcrR family transcriptional regulator|uniref:TetR/AcrR family transcriptional regulator n=1 Tax=Reinekea sp. TaxID=1970455 RepID=UPI003989A1A2